jgi:uncharacterized protein YukE
MSFDGMDVEQAQGLARQLEGHAQNLGHITSSLTALTMALSQSWHGPASAVFQQQWAAQHHPALNGAARAMSDLHAHLTANIQQQVRASAADSGPDGGGSGGGGGAWAVIAGVTAGLHAASETWDHYVGRFTGPLDKIRDLADNKWVTGRYPKTWTRLVNLDRDSSLFRYKMSPIFHALHDNALVQRADHLLTITHGDKVLDFLGPVGVVMSWAGVVADGGQALTDLHNHQYARAGDDLVNAAADGFKTRGLVGYLVGANIVIWKEDFDLASGIDWKQPIPNPFDAETFRDDYVPTFKSIPGQLADVVIRAFKP